MQSSTETEQKAELAAELHLIRCNTQAGGSEAESLILKTNSIL